MLNNNSNMTQRIPQDDVSPEYGSMSDDEQDTVFEHNNNNNNHHRRASWMRSVKVASPFQKLMDHNNHSSTNHRRISLSHNLEDHPLQAKCKLMLRDLCSPEKLRKKHAHHPQDEVATQSPQQPQPLTTPRSGKEDIEKVYEKFEILLDVLRMERHQEKLETDHEIKALKAKIHLLEHNHDTDDEESSNRGNDSIFKTKSLDNVTIRSNTTRTLEEEDLEHNTSDENDDTENDDPAKPSTSDYEQRLRDSVKQLMALDAQFVPEKDRKLLNWYFEDDEDNNKNNSNTNKVVDDATKKRLELQQNIIAEQEQSLHEMSTKYLAAMKEVQEQHDRIQEEEETNREITNTIEHVQEELQKTKQELEKARQKNVPEEEEDKENSAKMTNTTIKNELRNAEQKLVKTEGLGLEEKMNRQMKELNGKLHKLQGELSGSKRNHSDVLMKLAVESTCKASLSMKLDTAMAQIEKQKETISALQQELGKAQYECHQYSKQAQEVLRESKKLLLEETRVSLNDFSF